MKINKLIGVIALAGVFVACGTETVEKEQEVEVEVEQKEEKREFPNALANGKIFNVGDQKYMYGGEDSTWHFNVTNGILKDEQYHFGIGREAFHALIEPEYVSQEIADTIYADSSRFLVLNINEDVRAYSIELLTHHEIINDEVGGEPIMAAYCVLADLGAIYTRELGGRVFTFALSGYTYQDPEVWDGLDGFVFWDRETESTWWPLIGKAVSGPLLNMELKEYNEENWEQTTWGVIKQKYDNVMVLKEGQTMEPPKDWPKFNDQEIEEAISNW